MTTAQETFREMMRARIAPGLRALGFKGSGQNFELTSSTHWAMLGFQKDKWSTAERVTFTVNLLVISRERWEGERLAHPWLPVRPRPNTSWGVSAWERRIGELVPGVPGDQDLWWSVDAEEATDVLAEAVLWAIRDYALPAMRGRLED